MRHVRRVRADYPKGVVGVYDNGGRSADRYTVVFVPFEAGGDTYWPYLAMSAAPFHPQGVGLSGETKNVRPGTCGHASWGNACGKVIAFEALPADCQKAARQYMED